MEYFKCYSFNLFILPIILKAKTTRHGIIMKEDIKSKIDEAMGYIQNDTERAIEIFDEILKIDPENIEALNGKGSSLMKLNRMDDAEKYFDQSLSINETSSALISKGIISKNKKDYEQSLYYYDKAINLNPNLNNIITILKNEILELVDSDVEIYLNTSNSPANELIKKGLEYKKSNKLWDAMDCYEKAMKTDEKSQNSIQAMINEIKSILQNELMIKMPQLGKSKIDNLKMKSLKLLLIEENPKQAMMVMNLILEYDENDIDTLNQKGCILFLFDENKDALKCFEKCLKIDKTYYWALFNKAMTLRRMRNMNDALKCFDELLKMPHCYNKVKPYQLEILDKLHEENIE